MAEKKKIPEIRFKGFEEKWEEKKLGELIQIKDSARIPNELWAESGVRYLRSSDLENSGQDGKLFISIDAYEDYKSKTGAPERGDVLFNSGGNIGLSLLKTDNTPLYVQGGAILYARTSKSKDVDGGFLSVYFSTPRMVKYIDISSAGGTIKHFTLKPANAAPFIFPNVIEQREVSEFFQNLDKLITLHQAKYTKLVTVKKAMLEKMFPQNGAVVPEIRFKGFTEKWEERTLGELMEISSAFRVHKNEWTESGVPFFRTSDVVSIFKGLDNNKAFISFELYEELSKKSGSVQKNDLLVTGGGSIGIPYLVKTNEPLYFKDGDLLWLKNTDNINGFFLYMYFSTSVFRNYINSITHIGTISHYTIEQSKATPFKVPEKKEQIKIAEYFKHLDNLITLQQRELEKLKNIKKACLEKMFV